MEIGDCTRFIPRGWMCPVCGRVYAPDWPFCTSCGGEKTVTTPNLNATTDVDITQEEWVKKWKEIMEKAKVGHWFLNGQPLSPVWGSGQEDDEPTLEDWTRGEYPRE